MLIGNRKFLLGLAYLCACVVLGLQAIAGGADLTGLGIMYGGLATGVAAIVWGNVQESRARNGHPK